VYPMFENTCPIRLILIVKVSELLLFRLSGVKQSSNCSRSSTQDVLYHPLSHLEHIRIPLYAIVQVDP
jgi:hypothetical protein